MEMRGLSIALPLWARAFLLAGLAGVVLGLGLIAYRFYARPTTLSVAVGSFDGEAAKIASIIAGRLEATKSPVRMKIVPTDNVLDSAKLFAAGKTDLAIVRADVGDLSEARSVVLVAKSVLMILALPGSGVTSIDKMKGHTVGVVGGEINRKIVDALKAEYDLGDKVVFKNIAPADTPRAIKARPGTASGPASRAPAPAARCSGTRPARKSSTACWSACWRAWTRACPSSIWAAATGAS